MEERRPAVEETDMARSGHRPAVEWELFSHGSDIGVRGTGSTPAEAFEGDCYLSGDMMSRSEDGYFTYKGRSDDMLKVSGKWLSPGEVENCLLGAFRVSEVAMRYSAFVPRIYNLAKSLGFEKGKIMPSRDSEKKCSKCAMHLSQRKKSSTLHR